MARKTKDAPSGRVTPKGGTAARSKGVSGSSAGLSRTPRVDEIERGRPASGRYTAPIPIEYRESSRWVPIFMLTFFGVGLFMILLNYLGVLPGGASNGYLMGGLGFIVVGFITATRWH
jgi:Cell division protein CrgA